MTQIVNVASGTLTLLSLAAAVALFEFQCYAYGAVAVFSSFVSGMIFAANRVSMRKLKRME